MRPSRLPAAILVNLLSLASLRGQDSTAVPLNAAMTEFTSQRAALGNEVGVSSSDIVLRLIPWDATAPLGPPSFPPGMAFYQAWAGGGSHETPIMVAVRGSAAFLLAGTAAPQVIELTASLAARQEPNLDYCRVLARMVDPNGGAEVHFVGAPPASGGGRANQIAAAVVAAAPEFFVLADTVAVAAGGHTTCRVSTISRVSDAYLVFSPHRSAFVLDAGGRVLSWDRVDGPAIAMPD